MKKNIDLKELFNDKEIISKIKEKLPRLFRIAEIETSRAGKIGMEVGSVREKIVSALLIYKFGEENVDTEIPITEPETDIVVGEKNVSIKTITKDGGVKAVWTVDAQSSKKFIESYKPRCDIILVQIWWSLEKDSFFWIPISVQEEVFRKLGKNEYLKLPKEGTNPRGVEFSKEAINLMIENSKTLKIKIKWDRGDLKYDVYKRWVEYWKE
ncbi:ThaI family type II restriction endonuclease [Candidatus Pacearchaeota archaeon]|nr:ThaI family type II restriction endonuclease [Candidatus Pacearchaeota archaeon]